MGSKRKEVYYLVVSPSVIEMILNNVACPACGSDNLKTFGTDLLCYNCDSRFVEFWEYWMGEVTEHAPRVEALPVTDNVFFVMSHTYNERYRARKGDD